MSYTEEQYAAAYKAAKEGGHLLSEWEDCAPGWQDLFRAFANALAAESAGTPIAADQVREGDRVRGVITHLCSDDARGGIVEGEAYRSRVGDDIGVAGWGVSALTDLHLLHRPAPQLPTEPPAVILATEVRGVKGEWWMTLDAFGKWNSAELINTFLDHNPKHITSWKPADFVVRES